MQKCVIKVDSDTDTQVQHQTVIHEVIHIIMSQTGQDANVDPDRLEDLIDAVSSGIYQFLRDNSWFTRRLAND
jgi:hypothetical protein